MNQILKKAASLILAAALPLSAFTASPALAAGINQTALNALPPTLATILSRNPSPTFGDEWEVMDLARGKEWLPIGTSIPSGYFDSYYNTVVSAINGGSLGANTTYSRVALALGAIGKLTPSIGGYKIYEAYSSFSSIISGTINNPIYALIALNLLDAEPPAKEGVTAENQTTRQMLVDYILSKKSTTGEGWSLSGAIDPDITGMAIQALSPFYSQPAVKAAVDAAFTALSAIQRTDGGFASWGTVNAESCAQVVCALISVGRDPQNDPQFVKGGISVLDAMMAYYITGGGFKHTSTTGINSMATYQCGYALISYQRMVSGLNKLYDMTEVIGNLKPDGSKPGPKDVEISMDSVISGALGTEFEATVLLGRLGSGKRAIEAIFDIPSGVGVASVTALSGIAGGTIEYNLSNGKLRVVYINTSSSSPIERVNKLPQPVFSVRLKLEQAFAAGSEIEIAASSFRALGQSGDPADIYNLDYASAKASVAQAAAVTPAARELYRGDGVDLIPADSKAVAVAFANLGTATEIKFGSTDFYYAEELSLTNPTYVAIVSSSLDIDSLNIWDSYAKGAGSPAAVKFGDTDDSGIVNSQDALNVISAWLRKTESPSDRLILIENVTADQRIDTVDALAIVENFVSGTVFAVTAHSVR